MTESEEVAWINSLGFACTLSDLRASYQKFSPQAIDPNTNVLWDTESDELRNYLRLYKRTGYAPFLTQARYWRDYYVNTYSQWQSGGTNVIEHEHVYLMGLVDWYVDNKDATTLAAIDRILDFIIQKVTGNPFTETRVTARCLQSLCYYEEKIGSRDVRVKIDEFLAGIAGARTVNGMVAFRYAVGTGESVKGLPSGQDLRVLFPGNTSKGIVTGANSYDLKGFYGTTCFQEPLLMHALRVAARVLARPALADKAQAIAQGWAPHTKPPFYDANGQTYNDVVPYYFLVDAPEPAMFRSPTNGMPTYVAGWAPFAADATLKKRLSQAALLRGYGELSKIQSSELGGRPRLYPWQTSDAGYFMTQK
jgi:hypothetical protein